MHIGWSVTDVTPERPVILRGQFHSRVSRSIHDPLLATALAIEAGGEQAILVSCDRVGIPNAIRDRVRAMLGRRLPGFDPRLLVMNATHTHTAPEIEDGFYPPEGPEVMAPTEYADLFCERVAEGAAQAWEARRPGGVSWAFSHAVVGHNRRAAYFGGPSRMYGATAREDFEHIEGYEDHGVDLLFTWDAERRLTGMVINLACPSQVTENEYYVSADFWHEVRLEIGRRYGPAAFVLPQCSAAGDQSPHLLLHQRAEAEMLRRRGLSEREEIARRIANAVDEVLPLAESDIRTDVPLAHSARTVELPAARVTEEAYRGALARLEELERQEPDPSNAAAVSSRFVHQRRAAAVIKRFRSQGERPVYPVEVHVLRIGDIAIATNPFELFLDYGLRIKARSKALQTFVVQLAGSGGYLPTARAVAGGGYGAETVDGPVGPEGGQFLVEATLAEINKIME